MAYPTIYNVTYSYTGFQQAQGNNSFPGTQLDADLQGLKSSVSNLALFTQGVMRSDGALQNGVVNFDSLSTNLQTAGLAPALAWVTGKLYAFGAGTIANRNFYRCLVQHTSGVFATDLAAGNWSLVMTLLNGAMLQNGSGPPNVGVGGAGDFYIDIVGKMLYGPKDAVTGWPTFGTSTVGPQGASGAAGAAITFGLAYPTLTALNADLTPAANVGATVQADGANNGLYQKVGASGGGSWTRLSTFSFSSIDTRAAEAERRAWLDLRNSKVRFGVVGDSIYQGDHLFNAGGGFVTTQCRPLSWALALYPHIDFDVWYDGANSRNFAGLNNGYSGTTTAQALASLPALLVYQPDIVIEESGINSVTTGVSAASIQADKISIVQNCLNAGVKKVIMRTITPVSTGQIPDGDAKRTVLNTVNTWIRGYATSTPNVILFDAYPIYDDGTGHPKAAYTSDGLHPTSLGAQHEASDAGGLVAVLQKCIRPLPQRRTPDGINLSNNIKATSGGTLGTGVTGQIVAGFNARMLSGGAVTTVVGGIASRTDGNAYQQLDFTTHSGADPAEIFAITPISAIDFTPYANQWVRARLRVTVTPGAIIRGLTFQAGFVGCMNPLTTDTMINQTFPLDLESPPYKLGATPGTTTPFLWVYIDGRPAGSTASIQIDDFSIVHVDNAMYLHNTLGG